MLNSFILSASTLVFTLLGQDVRFDYQLAVPKNSTSSVSREMEASPALSVRGSETIAWEGNISSPSSARQPAFGQSGVSTHSKQRFTLKQSRVTAQELLGALMDEGVQLISPFDDDSKQVYSVHLSDQPIESVMRVLGKVMQGSWTLDGSIWVFESARPSSTIGSDYSSQLRPLQMTIADGTIVKRSVGKLEPIILSGNEDLLVIGQGQRVEQPVVQHDNHTKLLKSITPVQRKLHEKKGFLKFDDLSKTQLASMGAKDASSGFVILKFDGAGKAVTVLKLVIVRGSLDSVATPNKAGPSRK